MITKPTSEQGVVEEKIGHTEHVWHIAGGATAQEAALEGKTATDRSVHDYAETKQLS